MPSSHKIPFLTERWEGSYVLKRNSKTTVDRDLSRLLLLSWEQAVIDHIDEECGWLQSFHVTGIKSESSKITKRRLSPETIELVRERGILRAIDNCQLVFELTKTAER